MWISLSFLMVFVYTQVWSLVLDPIPSPDEPAELPSPSLFKHPFEHKLQQLDSTVQALQEKIHSMSVYNHHIASWNEQIKSLEHKMDTIKHKLDEQDVYGHKLISFEFTLNHVLSKVVHLSNLSCGSPMMPSSQRMENTESGRNVGESSSAAQQVHHHHHHAHDKNSLEHTLRSLERKMSALGGLNAALRDGKPLLSLVKKNARSLENILHLATDSNSLLRNLRDDNGRGKSYMTEHCQRMSEEMSRFTSSWDLLMKRVELMVLDAKEHVVTDADLIRGEEDNEEETTEAEEDASGEGDDVEATDEYEMSTPCEHLDRFSEDRLE